jgi:hypothetical protein
VLRVAQALLRNAQECSPSAQVKAAAAHVQTLKRNQQKKKVESDLSGNYDDFALAPPLSQLSEASEAVLT